MNKIIKLEQIAHYTGDVMTTNCTYEFSQAYKDGIISEIDGKLLINTPKGTRIAKKGDYIIKEQDGTFYSYTPEEFASIDMISCVDVDGKQIWVNKNEIYKLILTIEKNKLKIRIKYFEGATKLKKITKGNWIDVYANKDVFVMKDEREMIPLGFALELPQGWEGHLAPRSSTFKSWGLIQTNSVGVVDDTYIGDNDQWHMPVYCLKDKEYRDEKNNDYTEGVWIHKGDKIGQFRIMEVMPEIEFEEVKSFGNTDRGGFGTTGTV